MSNNPYQAPSASILTEDTSGFKDAGKGKRFLNALIDGLLFQVIAVGVGFALGASGKVTAEQIEAVESNALMLNLISILIWVAYYVLMEHGMGTTVGKLITGTRVVSRNGGRPTLKQIAGRSFARLIPFEAFSFLGSGPGGWHDSLSRTRVVLKA